VRACVHRVHECHAARARGRPSFFDRASPPLSSSPLSVPPSLPTSPPPSAPLSQVCRRTNFTDIKLPPTLSLHCRMIRPFRPILELSSSRGSFHFYSKRWRRWSRCLRKWSTGSELLPSIVLRRWHIAQKATPSSRQTSGLPRAKHEQ